MKGNFNYLKNFTWFVPNVPELIILCVWFIVGTLIGNAVSLLFTHFLGTQAATDYGLLVAYPLMFMPPMIYASFKSHSRAGGRGIELDRSNFKPSGGFLLAVVLSVATLASGIMVDAANKLLPAMPQALKQLMESLTGGNFIINLIMVAVFAPIFEEWLCRGMVLRGLLGNGTRPFRAIIISALFFAIIHLNPWQALPAFVLGCLFGYVYYRTGSLRLTMLMHCVNNTTALVIGHIDSLKDFDNWMDLLGPVHYWIVFAACTLFLALALHTVTKIKSAEF